MPRPARLVPQVRRPALRGMRGRTAIASAVAVGLVGAAVTLVGATTAHRRDRDVATADARAWLRQAHIELQRRIDVEADRLANGWGLTALTETPGHPWWRGVARLNDRARSGSWRAVLFVARPGRAGAGWYTVDVPGPDGTPQNAAVSRTAIWDSTPLLRQRRLPEAVGATLAAARDSGEPRLSPALSGPAEQTLITEPLAGTALAVPVFGDPSLVPPPLGDRADRLMGWLVADVVLQDLVREVTATAPAGTSVGVLDGTGRVLAAQVAQNAGPRDAASPEAAAALFGADGPPGGQLRVAANSDLSGSPISLVALRDQPSYRTFLLSLLVGLIPTAFVVLLFVGRVRAEGRARRMVDERTRELSRQTRDLELITHSTPDVLLLVDALGRVLFVNPAGQDLLGIGKGHVGQVLSDTGVPDELATQVLEALGAVLGGATGEARFDITLTHGTDRLDLEIRVVSSQHGEADETPDALVVARDVTERRAAERGLARQALHDPLTDLANRALIEESLDQALRRRGAHLVAVLLLDLDRFKLVNDSLGHAVGDELLVQFAERLRMHAREEDVVGRLGGDEFVFVAVVDEPAEAEAMGRRVLAILSQPFTLGGTDFTFTGSVGIALAHPGETDGATLLGRADAAMYIAKGMGGNEVALFRPEQAQHALERLVRAEELRVALTEDQLQLHFQPEVDLRDGSVTGVEALARWNHPDHGSLGPNTFIHIAEETGLILQLGAWVMDRCIAQAGEVNRARGGLPPIRFWVNVSARQVVLSDVADTVLHLLEVHDVPGDWLGIEITESTLAQDVDRLVDMLTTLRAAGVGVAVDDFGTGWSSLTRLRNLPVDVLKIDKAFVDAIRDQPAGRSEQIVSGIIAMGRALSATVVAEGIETPDQLATLQRLGCDVGQGYLFARPAPIDLVLDLDAAAAAWQLG